MEKFRNKYRIKSARASWWNYANNGYYFITICTAGREHLFGEIKNKKMLLSEIGKIVQEEWDKSFEIRAELFCDAFIIMPNHIHAIVHIENNDTIVETHGRASIRSEQTQSVNHGVAYRAPKSVSSFVGGFKSAATTRINKFRNTPGRPVWQSRFHDHIIRNDGEFHRIKNYIETNPEHWKDDKFFNRNDQ